MKLKIFGLAALTLLLLSAAAAQAVDPVAKTADGKPVKGLTFVPYQEAIDQAKEENKLVMIFFWADWCRYCTKIREDVFEKEKVREPFEKSFVAVSVDIGNDPEKVAEGFKPKALPTMAFLRPDGEVLGILPGYVDMKTFLELIEFVSTEALKTPAADK